MDAQISFPSKNLDRDLEFCEIYPYEAYPFSAVCDPLKIYRFQWP